MKKILITLMGFLTLGLINFSSAGSFTYTGDILLNDNHLYYTTPLPLLDNNLNSYNLSVSCSMTINSSDILLYEPTLYLSKKSIYGGFEDIDMSAVYDNNIIYVDNFVVNDFYLILYFDTNYYNGDFISGTYTCTLSGDNIINQSDLNGGSGEENSWSALYINDIQHVSAGIIDITIPEEIAWDYTGNDEIFNLYISGYNVDTQYMEDILTVQNYHPSSEDFTESFVGTLTLMFPYIVICLFIMFLWKLIKRIFK